MASQDERNMSGWTRLHSAVVTGTLNDVSKLLRRGADPNATTLNGETAIMLALYYHRLDMLPPLVQGGAQINTVDRHGNSAMGYAHAAPRSDREVAVTLVRTLGGTDDGSERGQLIRASGTGDSSEIQRLLEAGVPTDAFGPMGETALARAAWRGHLDVVVALLERGADVNLQDSTGDSRDTALMAAASSGQLEVVKLLIARGANLKLYSDPAERFTTARFHAEARNQTHVVNYLDSIKAP